MFSILCNYTETNVTTAISDGDFTFTSVTLTFATGSADGAEMCASVAVVIDNLVESDEDFTIELSLVTLAGTSLRLGNTEAAVTIVDSDGVFWFSSVYALVYLFSTSC